MMIKNTTLKRVLNIIPVLCLLIPLSSYSQQRTLVVSTPNTPITSDSSTSYIYCATMEMMWGQLRNYLGENPKTDVPNESIELLNESIQTNYAPPIEDKFVVAKAGLVSDSIVDKIRFEHKQKFNENWNPFYQPSESAILAYAYLQNDVRFKFTLDDKFDEQRFSDGSRVDCFGVDRDDPRAKREDILIHDYVNNDDFIIQIKSRDSLDEIYFAKSPKGATLLEMYNNTITRLDQNNMEAFTGNDILVIPYIKFDTTKRYSEIENAKLTNEAVQSREFLWVQQKIDFDLNPEGIKVKSFAAEIIDFADFETSQQPRVLSFNDPFLIIMKRKNSEMPYFLHWVANTDFMREYILTRRALEEEEHQLVGKWQFSSINNTRVTRDYMGDQYLELKSDGTFLIYRNTVRTEGIWEFSDSTLCIDYSEYPNRKGFNLTWKVEEVDTDHMTVIADEKAQIHFVKRDTEEVED